MRGQCEFVNDFFSDKKPENTETSYRTVKQHQKPKKVQRHTMKHKRHFAPFLLFLPIRGADLDALSFVRSVYARRVTFSSIRHTHTNDIRTQTQQIVTNNCVALRLDQIGAHMTYACIFPCKLIK